MKDVKQLSICNCGAPLVYTFMFSGAEYFCVECGGHYGMFDTEREDETPELKKRLKRNEKKWDGINKGLLTGGVMLRSCDKCGGGQTHLQHATPEELKAHKIALKKLEKIGA